MNTTYTDVTPFSLDLRAPGLEITAKPAHKRLRVGNTTAVLVKVTDERPNGTWFGTNGAQVNIQRRKGARWVSVPGAKAYTASNGAVRIQYKHAWPGRTKFRASASVAEIGSVATEFAVRAKRR